MGYVYVGQLERIQYEGAGIEMLDVLRRQGVLNVAYSNEGVILYRTTFGFGVDA